MTKNYKKNTKNIVKGRKAVGNGGSNSNRRDTRRTQKNIQDIRSRMDKDSSRVYMKYRNVNQYKEI